MNSDSIDKSSSTAASRLCRECGLCCNGVMFHLVQLQPTDSRSVLAALGLHVKRKRKQDIFQQPCPAFCDSSCSIYEQRPERCRVFACRQLQRVTAGEIREEEALAKIRSVLGKVAEIDRKLALAGTTNKKRPLAKRCEKILAVPPADEATEKLHAEISNAIEELDNILDADFRIPPELVLG